MTDAGRTMGVNVPGQTRTLEDFERMLGVNFATASLSSPEVVWFDREPSFFVGVAEDLNEGEDEALGQLKKSLLNSVLMT